MSIQLSRKQVEESMKTRIEPLQIAQMVNTIKDLSKPREEDPGSLAEAMEKVPGYGPAVCALVNFMVNPQTEEELAENQKPVDVLQTLGLERARNLALTFFAINYEAPHSTHFDWTPLWRHSLAVGVVLDFLYDALDVKRTGYEYVAGTFHDVGKFIFAELFPYAYFSTMNRCLSDEVPLATCEMEMFGITHAELGGMWLKQEGFSHILVDAVGHHEIPDQISRRAVLSHALVSANHLVKQIGIGYSGNSSLDPRTWEELPSTGALWDARGNKDYAYNDFVHDIMGQFQSFPDLL